MAIERIEVKNLMAFKGEFSADFCKGVNVLIGGNGTGKTTLLRAMNGVRMKMSGNGYFSLDSVSVYGENVSVKVYDNEKRRKLVYLPEKDILEHSKGLLTFIEEKQTGFGQEYKEILIKAQDTQTNRRTEFQKHILKIIFNIIGGETVYDMNGGEFVTVRKDGVRIPFTNEASGFKKLGLLGLLVASGQITDGTVLFWDEPENSLNPEIIPKLVEILLELSRNGVQIFLATHSEILADYISTLRQKQDEVMFYSLYKADNAIKYDSSERFDLLKPNTLTEEPVRLYEKKLERGAG